MSQSVAGMHPEMSNDNNAPKCERRNRQALKEANLLVTA